MTSRYNPMDSRSEVNPRSPNHSLVREYYDRIYYKTTGSRAEIPKHYRRLARRLQPWRGKRLLDVACGTGEWLRAAANYGALPAGVDISRVALDACGAALPLARLHCGPAEELPFGDREFDFISCLGALEHFIEPAKALRQMVRVAKPSADFLLLVPNADFPPRRLGLYAGTEQAAVREEVRSLED